MKDILLMGADKMFLVEDKTGKTNGVVVNLRYRSDRSIGSIELKDQGYPVSIETWDQVVALINQERTV